ncbi:hypothetical protein BGX29_008828 [Mortierella sp. GBA35]|nr:hypothetical protein BGX29_008828 [Mortierella sp. GBA35]
MHSPFKSMLQHHQQNKNKDKDKDKGFVSPLTQTTSHVRASTTFFGIPELLDAVFSFVDQETLHKTVILVCREWFSLNRQRVSRELVWDYRWYANDAAKALTRLPGAGRLVWHCDRYCEATWSKFIKSLERVEKRVDKRNSKRQPFQIFSSLRQIELYSGYHLGDEFFNRLAFPSTLTSIKLFRYSATDFDIGRILVICPHLEILHACSRSVLNLQGPWTSQGPPNRSEPLPLRSLVLENAKLSQSWIERLVTNTPHLKELKLINLTCQNGDTWDWPSLFQHLRSLPFALQKFHYSVHGEIPSESDLDDMLYALCPNASERTLWGYNLTPGIVRSLTEQPSVLTSLDVLWHYLTNCHSDGWKEGDYFYSSTFLHRLLCESPGLRHLKTLKAPYLIEHMDVHRRIKAVYDTMFPEIVEGIEAPVFHPGVWICRNLQVLHLQVHSHGGYRLHNPQDRQVLSGYISRTLFSYISKVTPQLRDLHIEEPYSCSALPGFSFHSYLSESLDGGLVLLSSLQYLERLRVEFDGISCGLSELNWIYSSGRTAQYRSQRWSVMFKWEDQLERELQVEAIRLQAAPASTLSGSWSHELELLRDLQSTGFLQEVKTKVEMIHKGDSVCFPSLRKLSLSRELERSPERNGMAGNNICNAVQGHLLKQQRPYCLQPKGINNSYPWMQDERRPGGSKPYPGGYGGPRGVKQKAPAEWTESGQTNWTAVP